MTADAKSPEGQEQEVLNPVRTKALEMAVQHGGRAAPDSVVITAQMFEFYLRTGKILGRRYD